MRSGNLALAASLILALALAPTARPADQAPDFTLPDLDKNPIQLSKVCAEGPVVLSFWATWCVPCPEEMKHLQRLYEKYQEQGLQVLCPAIDGSKTVSKVKPFVMGRRFTYPIPLDTNNDVKRLYRVAVVPTLFLINTQGEIVYHHVGYRPGDEVELEKEIQKVLAACASSQSGEEQKAMEPAATVKEATEGAREAGSTDADSEEGDSPPGTSSAPAPSPSGQTD